VLESRLLKTSSYHHFHHNVSENLLFVGRRLGGDYANGYGICFLEWKKRSNLKFMVMYSPVNMFKN
jgi:hypothetical protein